MNRFLESVSQGIFKRSRLECVKNGTCVCCGKPAASFTDKLSEKEFT